MTTSAGKAAKAALITDLQTLFPAPTLIAYGFPGTYLPDEIVAVRGVTSDREFGPMSTQRKLTETLAIDLVVSVASGGPDSQQAATERAWDMLATIETYLSDVGVADSAQLTLSHSVWQAWVSHYDLVESDESLTDADGTPLVNKSRWCDIDVTVSAKARI